MTHYKHEAKQAAHDKMERMGLHKEHSGKKHFDDVHPYDGVPQLSTETPSGAAPVGKQRFKRGGKVAHLEGNKAKHNLGKKPRGKSPAPFKRDEELASGGVAAFNPLLRKKRAAAMAMRKKREGLPYGVPMSVGANMMTGVVSPHKKGGSVSAHPDEAEDRKLIRKEVKPSALKHRAHKNEGGAMRSERTQYEKARRNSVDEGMDLDTDSQHTQETLRKAVRNFENTAKETGYSNLKRGGRAHKLSGGALMNYIGAASKNRDTHAADIGDINERAKTERKNSQSSAEFRDYANKMSNKRTSGLRLAAEKLAGVAKVPARFSEEPMNRGGRAHKADGGETGGKIDVSKWHPTRVPGNKAEHEAYEAHHFAQRYAPSKPERESSSVRAGSRPAGRAWYSTHPDSPDQKGYEKGGRAHRATGGKVGKGKTSINIIISPEGQKGASQTPMGGPPAIPPQLLAAMAGGGAGGPPPGAGGPPPGAMPPGAGMAGAGGGLGAGPAMNVGRPGMTAPTPPMRKAGGRVGGKTPQAAMPTHQEHDYGSGSGLGRLEKRKWPLAK